MDYSENSTRPEPPRLPHYYGDIVRTLFLLATALLMISALLDEGLFAFYLFVGIFVVLGLVILAGLTTPKNRVTIVIDTVVSAALLVFFEYSAMLGHSSILQNGVDAAFILRQLLAIIFLMALYFSIKTWRGMLAGKDL